MAKNKPTTEDQVQEPADELKTEEQPQEVAGEHDPVIWGDGPARSGIRLHDVNDPTKHYAVYVEGGELKVDRAN
jgi:hypothetical protein